MKKVALITILDNVNFGTILQAYALARKIEEAGFLIEFINYWRPNSSIRKRLKKEVYDEKLSLVTILIRVLSILLIEPLIKYRLRSFLTKRFAFTRRYSSFEALRENPPQADLYLTGSDQVWNSSYNDGVDQAFFLNFTKKRKCSYAASVGIDAFPSSQVQEVCCLLRSYSEISVREILTYDYLKRLGVSHLSYDLDPTFLLDKEEWKNVIGYQQDDRKGRIKYLLVYSVEEENNGQIFETARAIARLRGLKIYAVIGRYSLSLRKFGCDRVYSCASPACFLRLMLDADFVVASSFHGTAFSLNFNKDFVSILPDRFSVRQRSLEVLFPSISERIRGLESFDVKTLQPLDYADINLRLAHLRATSRVRLKEVLSNDQ